MKIGKYVIDVQYDMECDRCGNYRSSIGWSTLSLSTKPTAKILKNEGWMVVDGIGQLCPNCAAKMKEVKE